MYMNIVIEAGEERCVFARSLSRLKVVILCVTLVLPSLHRRSAALNGERQREKTEEIASCAQRATTSKLEFLSMVSAGSLRLQPSYTT